MWAIKFKELVSPSGTDALLKNLKILREWATSMSPYPVLKELTSRAPKELLLLTKQEVLEELRKDYPVTRNQARAIADDYNRGEIDKASVTAAVLSSWEEQ